MVEVRNIIDMDKYSKSTINKEYAVPLCKKKQTMIDLYIILT